ncbi:protein of unknown function [Denitratisoma oestradiolicum]|uniref:Uncharacterized protein n=1 Tax=Denitratisoma oestradiolicum TaxID=311182 RepID=A0A6S6XY26_9PROT|nr:protein of unknown function [Denitratisoma oestradiolicum]
MFQKPEELRGIRHCGVTLESNTVRLLRTLFFGVNNFFLLRDNIPTVSHRADLALNRAPIRSRWGRCSATDSN